MVTRRQAMQWTAAGVLMSSAAMGFEGPARALLIEPHGDIQTPATVWLVNGTRRTCLWQGTVSPVPSIAPGVEHRACVGVVEVEIAGTVRLRRAVSSWRPGTWIELSGPSAGLTIGPVYDLLG